MLIRRYFWAIVVLILVVGLGFRLPGLASRSLWIDELYSAWFAARPFGELWHDVPTYENHPPAYYTLLRAWSLLFGDTEAGLRSLSLLASLVTVGVIAWSGRLLKVGGPFEAAGLLGAAFLAVNYASIREAQNARPYALQGLLCTVAIVAAMVLVMRLRRPPADTDSMMDGWLLPSVLLGLSAGGALWMHNTSLFFTLGLWSGLGLSLLAMPRDLRLRNVGIVVASGILALAVWSPNLPLFVEQARAFSGLAFWLKPALRDLHSAWLLVVGDSWPVLLLSLGLLMLGLVRLGHQASALALLAASVLIVPLYTLLAVSFAIKPIFIQRLFAWMVPLALLVMAFGIVTASGRIWPRVGLALLIIVLGAARSIQDIDRPIDDWKAIVAEIARNARPGDVVIASPAEGSVAVGYYARRYANFPKVVCIPGCYPQRHLPRTYLSNFGAPAVIEADGAIVDRALASHGRVWLVEVSVALYDPRHVVRRRIAANRRFVGYVGNAMARVDLFD